jgi:hypothetical protein
LRKHILLKIKSFIDSGHILNYPLHSNSSLINNQNSYFLIYKINTIKGLKKIIGIINGKLRTKKKEEIKKLIN